MARVFRWGGKRAGARNEPKPNKEGRATAARPSSRSLSPKASAPKHHQRNGAKTGWHLQRKRKEALRPLLGRRASQPISSEPAPSHRPWASAPGATPQRTISEHGDAVPDPELQPRPPLRTRRPRSPQACQRGASPRRILVSLGGLLIAVAEPTPLRRSWMSPLGARPLADRFQTTTNRKTLAPPVTSLRDPTIPISVTEFYDLTRTLRCDRRSERMAIIRT